mgnify:CR=1 FL=1
MKQNRYIREAGPFVVLCISQDGHGVRMVVYPAFPGYNHTEGQQESSNLSPEWTAEPRWAIHRARGDGGGPGIFSAIALAKELEAFLNQPYPMQDVDDWKATLAEALATAIAERPVRSTVAREGLG